MIDSVWRRYVGTVRPMVTPPPSRVSMAYQRVRGRWPKVLDGRTPLIRFDAETGHALEVRYVAGHDCVASMAQGDRRREQVREADRLPSPSNRPRNPGGTDRAPPFEREEVHLIQQILDPLLLCGAVGVPQVLDAQVELERSDFGRPEGLLFFDRLDSRFRGWQAAKDVD